MRIFFVILSFIFLYFAGIFACQNNWPRRRTGNVLSAEQYKLMKVSIENLACRMQQLEMNCAAIRQVHAQNDHNIKLIKDSSNRITELDKYPN